MEQPPGNPDHQAVPANRAPACYRHPDRETHITCTRCERPICPECMVNASVGFQCPECVRSGSGTGHAPGANQPRTVAGGTVAADPRLVTKILLGINIAVFLVVFVQSRQDSSRLVTDLALLGAWPPEPFQPVEGVAAGDWYRLMTSVFLHQEIWHIAFNMLGLWWLGGPLEAALGRVRYLVLYLASGFAGSALAYLLEDPDRFTLGASGAIFGLFGATAVLMRRMNYDMRPVIALLVINLIFTFGASDISWQAHVGGLVAGVAIGIGMVYAPSEKRSLVQFGTGALVVAVSVVLVLLRTAALT